MKILLSKNVNLVLQIEEFVKGILMIFETQNKNLTLKGKFLFIRILK